jgi:hypothetical protein
VAKILDMLKQTEQARSKGQVSKAAGAGAAGQQDHWTTNCLYVRVALFVYGYTADDIPFHEVTYTIAINAQGGWIVMRTRVQPGQRLVVTNQGNEWTQECIVVSIRVGQAQGIEVAVEFPNPLPDFWRNLETGKDTDL